MRCWTVSLLLSVPLLAGKPVLKPADAAKWENPGAPVISNDGKWLAQPIRFSGGDSELRVYPTSGGKPHVTPMCGSPAFSANSFWIACSVGVSEGEREKLLKDKKPVHDKLEVRNLASGQATTLEAVQSFSFSKRGAFLAIRRYPAEGRDAASLVVRDLALNKDFAVADVSAYVWNDQEPLLALTISAPDKIGNGLQVLNGATGAIRVLDSSAALYSTPAWRKHSTDVAVLRSKENANYEGEAYTMLAWRSLEQKHELDAELPAGKRVVKFRVPEWSDDGKCVFVGIGTWERKPPKKDKDKEPEPPSDVEIWHSADTRIIPEQKLNLLKDKERSTLAVWHVDSRKFVSLSDDVREQLIFAKKRPFAVAIDPRPFENRSRFGRPGSDVFRIDTLTGVRTRIAEDVPFTFGLSPGGRYFLFLKANHYWIYDLDKSTTKNLTAEIRASFVNLEDDHPMPQKLPFFGVNWTKEDRSVLLNSEFDVWELFPGGSSPRALTSGAKDEVVYRFLKLDREQDDVDLAKPAYFSLYGKWTKSTGFARLSGGTLDCLTYLDRHASALTKAKDADVYVYTAESFDASPNAFVAGPDLKHARQITQTNPQQNNFAWPRNELIEYQSPQGVRLQGILVYPANFESGKKYPMIVEIYEKLNNLRYRYSAPSERNMYNQGMFSQEGYFVLRPDIVFRPRNPGPSVAECVTAAVKKALETGNVDEKRIGLVGHSWGGFGTAFTVTQTDLFAAAISSGPLTNLSSSIGEIYWNTGMPETGHAETGQERMEVPIYADPEAYVRNSAVFFADRVKTPLMMMVGDKDGASDWHQDIEMYNALRRAGKQTVLLVYPGENHIPAKRANQLDYTRRVREWFGYYLKGEPAAKWITGGQSAIERDALLKPQK